MNKENIQKWAEVYKNAFADRWDEQSYKWEAAAAAARHWNIEAPQLLLCFKSSAELLGKKQPRLLRPHGRRMAYGMLHEFIRLEEVAARDMFRGLYADAGRSGVDERIACFVATVKEIKERRRRLDQPQWHRDFQAPATASVLLWLHNPECYIYAEPEWMALALKEQGFNYTGSRRRLAYEEALAAFVCLREVLNVPQLGLREMLDSRLDAAKHYADPALSLLSNDFLEFVGREVKRLCVVDKKKDNANEN